MQPLTASDAAALGPLVEAQLQPRARGFLSALRHKNRHFAPALETYFQAELTRSEAPHFYLTMLVALLLFLAAGLLDRAMIPDQLGAAWTLRAIIAGIFAYVLVDLRVTRASRRCREAAASCMLLAMCMLPFFVLPHSTGFYRRAMLEEDLVILVYGSIAMHLAFEVTLAGTASCATAIITTVLNAGIAMDRASVTLSEVLTLTLLAIAGAHRLEQQRRENFLLKLRETVRSTTLAVTNLTLQELSDHDELTGLLNRRGLKTAYDVAAQAATERGAGVGLLLIDADFFKHFNDRYGHVAGDDALRRLAAALRGALRAGDLCGRFGGEEFLAILPGQDHPAINATAARIHGAIQQALILHESQPNGNGVLTVSIGVAFMPAGLRTSFTDLLQQADEHLYVAKRSGRNRVVASPPAAPAPACLQVTALSAPSCAQFQPLTPPASSAA
jgi:diguanylate cyclase (GGDEF)-like protein